jgi:hypothetical protein
VSTSTCPIDTLAIEAQTSEMSGDERVRAWTFVRYLRVAVEGYTEVKFEGLKTALDTAAGDLAIMLSVKDSAAAPRFTANLTSNTVVTLLRAATGVGYTRWADSGSPVNIRVARSVLDSIEESLAVTLV